MISQRIRSATYMKGKKDDKCCDDEQALDHDGVWSDDEDTLLDVASEHNDVEQEELDYFEEVPVVGAFTPKHSSNSSFNKSTRAFFS